MEREREVRGGGLEMAGKTEIGGRYKGKIVKEGTDNE